MKKENIFLFFLLLFSISCSSSQENKKAQQLFNQASAIFQNANTIEWKESTKEKTLALKKLDQAILFSPEWWNPYREKIQILLIGSWSDNSDAVNDVYNTWLKNGNSLEGSSLFAYGCSLYCCNKEAEAINIFNKVYANNLKEEMTDSEKIIFLLSGIILGEIREQNLKSIVIKLFDDSMCDYFEEFLSNFNDNGKETLWAYAGF